MVLRTSDPAAGPCVALAVSLDWAPMISPFTPDEIELVSMLLRSRCFADTPVEEIERKRTRAGALPGP